MGSLCSVVVNVLDCDIIVSNGWLCFTACHPLQVIKCLILYTHIYIYIYIYVYIVNHRQTVSLYNNSSVWLDTRDGSNQPNFNVRSITYLPSADPKQAREFNVYVLTSVCLHFTLSDTEVFNFLEEICISDKICKRIVLGKNLFKNLGLFVCAL